MSSPNPHGGPPITFIRPGSRGPGVNVPANPVLGTPQAGPGPDSPPVEPIDHAPVGLKPRIDYQPGAVDGTAVSLGDILYDPRQSPAPTIDPPASSTTDIGALGDGFQPPDDGDTSIGNIGHGASGVVPALTLPAYDDLPVTTELPATAILRQSW